MKPVRAVRKAPSFARRIVAWQRRHGRHGLPWQGTRDPYRVWLSEIMLQQTQVATAIPYYERFLTRFPDVAALACAEADEVMRHWSGLGYYARARNLHRAAAEVLGRHGGRFPLDAASLEALPGIGRSTAAAILAFATGEPHAILDGNVKRVLARHEGIEGPADAAPTLARLWTAAGGLLPRTAVEAYTQGLMDLGATVCTRLRPACDACPVRATCAALAQGRVDELPGRKRAKAVRRRDAVFAVVTSRGEVLVEKRPPRGLWGGLWSLPEVPPGEDPAAWAARSHGVRVRKAEALAPFDHAFTHFTLRIHPWRLWLSSPGRRSAAGAALWLPLGEVFHAALPAPVKRLLASLAEPAPSPAAAARAGSDATPPGARRRR